MYLGLINLNAIFAFWFHACLLKLLYRLGQKEKWKWAIVTHAAAMSQTKAAFLGINAPNITVPLRSHNIWEPKQ